jgi:thioredoxin reductase (NADPH)
MVVPVAKRTNNPLRGKLQSLARLGKLINMASPYDIICIGAGPTGLACAIEAKRAGLRPLVIDKGVLCNSLYHYPVNMVFFTTPELLEIGDLPFVSAAEKPTRVEALKYYRKCVEHYDLELRLGETVTRVEGADGNFRVHTRPSGAANVDPVVERQKGVSSRESLLAANVHQQDELRGVKRSDQELSRVNKDELSPRNKVYASQKLIVATGYYDLPNRLGVPGEDLPHVSHYYTEPHPFWRQDVVVIGGKNSAAEAALDLYRSGARVTLVHRRAELGSTIKYWVRPDIENRIKARQITALFETRVMRIEPGVVHVVGPPSAANVHQQDELRGVNKVLPAMHVFVLTGYHPDFDFLRQLGVQLDAQTNKPALDPQTLESNVPGLYLAGVVIGGNHTSEIFIENGRFHGKQIIAALTGTPLAVAQP